MIIYFALAIYLLPMFPYGGSANELTDWATAASLIEKGSFDIAWTEDLIGKNADSVKIDDRVYSKKMPGTAVLTAPFYAVTRIFVGAPDASNIRVSWFLMRFFISTLPLFLLAFWLYKSDADEFSLAAVLFTTPIFIYSLLLYSHVFVAVTIYFAFRLLFDERFTLRRSTLAAGFLSGLAIINEFTAIFPTIIFGIGLFFTDKRERNSRIYFYILGVLPFLIALMLYNYTLFGAVFSMSDAYQSSAGTSEIVGQNTSLIGLPSLSNIYLLLFSPSRGLFFYSPILIFSVINFFRSKERRTLRHRVKIAAIAVSVLFVCGQTDSGWMFGARHLIFIIPLLLDTFFDGEIYDFSNIWQGFLFGLSFLFCTIPALTFPLAPPEFQFPHNDFFGSLLFYETWIMPNLLNNSGISTSLWTIIPPSLLLVSALYFVYENVRRPKRFALGLLFAAIIFAFYSFLPNLDDKKKESRRAEIIERYLKPENRSENF